MELFEAFFDRVDFKLRRVPEPIGKGDAHCPICGGPGIKKGSTLGYKEGGRRVQKYICIKCGRRFNENTSLEALQSKARIVLEELSYFKKVYLCKIFDEILRRQRNVKMLKEIVEATKFDSIKHDSGVKYAVIYLDNASLRRHTLIAVIARNLKLVIKSPKSILILKTITEYVTKRIRTKYFVIINNYYDDHVNNIRKLLPEAIHIRLRSGSLDKQYIYVYFKYRNHIHVYTFKSGVEEEIKLVSVRRRRIKETMRLKRRTGCTLYHCLRHNRKYKKLKRRMHKITTYSNMLRVLSCAS